MKIRIGERKVGDGCPVYVVAEAGSNHEGDLGRALDLIDIAAEAGADAAKFQLFRADRLYPPGPEREAVRPYELPPAWLPDLAGRCADRGIDFLCTPFDEEAVDLLAPHVPAFKVASYDLTNEPLLRKVGSTGKPILLSTGASTDYECIKIDMWLHASFKSPVILLQCTAAYPAPIETLNLRALEDLPKLWTLRGLSDHSLDPILAPVMAVALGACVIEKHFKLPDSTGPDAAFAVDPDGLAAMVRAIRNAEKALGSGVKEVLPVEEALRRTARRDPATGLRYGGAA